MRRPAKLRQKLLILGLLALVLAAWTAFRLPCPFRYFTGIPCPGCGMSRAWLLALGLDLHGAFRQHPMFWSVPILVLFLCYDGALLRGKFWNGIILSALAGGIVLVYLGRLFGFLGGLAPL